MRSTLIHHILNKKFLWCEKRKRMIENKSITFTNICIFFLRYWSQTMGICFYVDLYSARSEADSGGRRGGSVHPFFAITCFFYNHFEELQTVLLEVELIINNKHTFNIRLTYRYPNTIETCFTPNHLLFRRQLLYSFRTIFKKVRHLL